MVINLIKVGRFPRVVNQRSIILTFKNEEKDNFNNQRLITLFNVTYNIYALTLQN
jgi:hypothetical protein